MTSLDIGEIRRFLPHRYPFLLVDRVVDYVPGERLSAIKNVSVNEPFFEGHFPHKPVMPGVLILESMAQACALLAACSIDEPATDRRVYLFAGVDGARFKRQVEPGDRMDIEATMVRRLRGIWKCAATVHVDGHLCCEAELMFTYRDL